MITKTSIFLSLALLIPLFGADIKTISFDGNTNIKTKTLNAITKEYVGIPLNETNAQKIADTVQNYYRRHDYALAYATVSKIDTETKNVVVSIRKHNDFNHLSLHEMKQKPIVDGKINQIFFTGNEKLSTNRLSNFILPMIGKENTAENRQMVLDEVQKLYRQHHYELAYTELVSDENGVLTIVIKKYPNFKARYAKESKS